MIPEANQPPETGAIDVGAKVNAVKLEDISQNERLIILFINLLILCSPFIITLGNSYLICCWAISLGFTAWIIYKRFKKNILNFIYVLIIIDCWLIYNLLPWSGSEDAHEVLSILIQVFTIIVCIFYAITELPLCIYIQFIFTFFPTTKLSVLSTFDIFVITVSFCFCWNLFIASYTFLKENHPVRLRLLINATYPLLRCKGPILAFYIGFFCTALALKIYIHDSTIENILFPIKEWALKIQYPEVDDDGDNDEDDEYNPLLEKLKEIKRSRTIEKQNKKLKDEELASELSASNEVDIENNQALPSSDNNNDSLPQTTTTSSAKRKRLNTNFPVSSTTTTPSLSIGNPFQFNAVNFLKKSIQPQPPTTVNNRLKKSVSFNTPPTDETSNNNIPSLNPDNYLINNLYGNE